MSRSQWSVLFVIVGVIAAAVLLPCVPTVRDNPGYLRSAVNLKMIGLGLRNYYDVNGKLPPAIIRDQEGRPLYSWRVALLPFLEQDPLHAEFKLDEAWDGPHNQTLLKEMPRCFRPAQGGSDPPGLTRYQALVGPGTAFERGDIPKGVESSVLVAEAADPVPWTKPADLVYDPNGPLPPMRCEFSKPVKFLCHVVGRQPGFNACFGDTTTRFIPADTDEGVVRQMITR